ncbi:M56 family metallopeptidase [Aureibaculum conchae]|uniref:M56 family metallopeptidase n=1 Tax=Aureibaculum sp. 2308TA14-22 TaxID=3108392 RepID=UPI003390C82B
MEYFLKANGLVILLWLFYSLVLKNETFFKAIRGYFLLGLVIIIAIPLIEIPVYVEKAVSNFNGYVVEGMQTTNTYVAQKFDWFNLLMILYFAGIVFFSFKFILQLFSLGKLLTSHKITRQGRYKLVETDKEISPFSFLNFIVYNKSNFTVEEISHVLNHEKTHVNQWHSIDTLLTNIFQIVFWFNPFAWLYKKAVQQNLEFLTDNHVFNISKSQQSYQKLLVKTSTPNYQMALANNFYNSFLKKRILMLHSEKSNRKSQLKFALVLPLLIAFIFAFNTKTIAQEKEKEHKTIVKKVEIHAMILTKTTHSDDLDKISKSFAEKGLKVEFKGIKRNKDNEITSIKIDAKANNGKTSASYSADENEGINPIKIEYDSENNSLSIGSSNSNYSRGYAFSKEGKKKIIKQKGKGKSYVFISDDGDSEENKSTKIWVTKDGDTVKIQSKKIIIENEEDEDGEHEDAYEVIIDQGDEESWGKLKIQASGKDEPIYILNGEEITKKEIDKLSPNKIKSMNIIKGKKAEEKYGDKGKNGVIEITLKKE